MTARRATALLSLVATLSIPAAARADGDPASDVLLFQDAYLPYFPAPGKPEAQTLTRLLKEVRRAGYPMKVALIESQGDLGAYPDLFGRPEDYAELLQREISFRVKRPHLLIVMPSGMAGRNLGRGASVLSEVEIDRQAQSDGLVRAALEAVAEVASANGHPTAVPDIAADAQPEADDAPHTALYVLAAVIVALGLALVVVALLSRRARRAPG